ncbi:MAG: methyltransferase type 11 [Opitutia bacterium]|nr:class I SAM-dependent methyltransferase [Opitutaceae bacterium]PHX72510.1 MAG: methyltransferase type 11 [Opitutae bacterium]
MILRESGMPAQDYWETLLNVPLILDAFGLTTDSTAPAHTGDIAELGCGYGTFTIPLAARIRGTVQTFDIDPAMVATTTTRASAANLPNVRASVRDVLAEGFGVSPTSCDAVLLFNILHAEEPVALLRAARDIVRPGGFVAVIHWRSDRPTPRGPSLAIRPTPAQILAWAHTATGLTPPASPLNLPPWHYGLKFHRT